MKKHSTVEYWVRELDEAQTHRDDIAVKYEWKKLKDLWNNGGMEVSVNTSSKTQSINPPTRSAFVNWVFSFISTFIPAVYWRHPKVFLDPKKSMFTSQAKIAEYKLNSALEITTFRRHCEKDLLDALIYGHAWMKVGWFTSFGQVPPNPAATGFDGKDSTVDKELWFFKDEPYSYRVSPESILVDPEADSYEEMRWIAQEHCRLFEQVKKDPYLKDANLEHAKKMTLRQETSLKTADREDAEWVRIWEIWDKDTEKVYFYVEGCDKISRTIDFPYNIKGFPFELLTLNDAIDCMLPPSIIIPWLPLVEELAFIRSVRLDHLSRMVSKYVIAEGSMNDAQKDAFTDPDNELCEAANPDGIKEFSGLRPLPELYQSEEGVKQDIREISGFSELLSGSIPYSKVSATSASIMQKNSALRFNFSAERVGEFIKACAKKLLQIIVDYQQYPDTIRVSTDPTNPPIEYERDDINGEFLYTINVEDMSFTSREQKVKSEYDALTALAQFPQVKVHSLIRDALSAWGKDPIEDYLNPEQGPPLDPAFENEMMIRGAPVQPNQMEDMQTHLAVHSQFMNSPIYMNAIKALPQVAALFNEHVQITLGMYDSLMRQQGSSGPQKPQAGISPSLQGGSAGVGSRPINGAKNMRGPSGNPLMQAMGGEIQ
jgi:hypothetical protein